MKHRSQFERKPNQTICGRHTKCSAVMYIQYRGRTWIKQHEPDYLNWPTKAIFLPTNYDNPHFLFPLLCLGNLDNETLQLPVTYIDRALKARELFCYSFPDGVEEYKKKDQDTKVKKADLGKQIQMTLLCAPQTAGSYRNLVAVDQDVWDLFMVILGNDYLKAEEFEKQKKKKGKLTHRKQKPLNSAACLAPFLGLPSPLIKELLTKVTYGEIPLKVAQTDAINIKSLQKLIAGFEKLANPGLERDDSKYLTWETFKNNHPTLAAVLESTELPRFALQSRTISDLHAFQDAVFRALRAANIIQNKEVKENFNFNELLNETAIDQIGEKVHVFSASGKGSVMAINCSTEVLPSYFKLSSRIRIGMLFFFI